MSLPELRRYPAGTDFIGFGDRVPVVARQDPFKFGPPPGSAH